MKNNYDNYSIEEIVVKYLKKNTNFFLKFPELLEILNFNGQINKSNKIVDLNLYRTKKLKKDYDQFITAFLSMLAERGHLGDLLEHGISVAKKKYQNTS